MAPTSDTQTVIVLGRDHAEAGSSKIGLALSGLVGHGISVGRQLISNEDAFGAARVGRDAVVAIADGHWGAEASEYAVATATRMLLDQARPAEDNEARGRLFALFEQINRHLFETAMSAPGAPTAETTLIVCWLRATGSGARVIWASFGDSSVYLVSNGTLRELNRPVKNWLGLLSKLAESSSRSAIVFKHESGESSEYGGVSASLETGVIEMTSQDTLLLCTDGVADLIREGKIMRTELLQVVEKGGDLDERADRVLKLAHRAILRDALVNDNLTCALVQPRASIFKP